MDATPHHLARLKQAIEAARGRTDGPLLVHRPLDGEHVHGARCWCEPHVVGPGDGRPAEDIVAEIARAQRPH